eukprot:TRINITY_DN22274_c0_g1_i1.p1 TRINITY_DN22274_c0_g1~~TRINITY_DN22274_c0_g1_i1.p1  ORF type:complete len:606 (+),score=244.76 TRINITY_DN22274_c0_g1_i1:88-1905(+)
MGNCHRSKRGVFVEGADVEVGRGSAAELQRSGSRTPLRTAEGAEGASLFSSSWQLHGTAMFAEQRRDGRAGGFEQLTVPVEASAAHVGQVLELVPPCQAACGRAVRATVVRTDPAGVAVVYAARPADAAAWGLPLLPPGDGQPAGVAPRPGEVLRPTDWASCRPRQLSGKVPIRGRRLRRMQVRGVQLEDCSLSQCVVTKCSLAACRDVHDSVLTDCHVSGPCLLRDCHCIDRCDLERGEGGDPCKLQGCRLNLCTPVAGAELERCVVEESVVLQCTLARDVTLAKRCCVEHCTAVELDGSRTAVAEAGCAGVGCVVEESCKVSGRRSPQQPAPPAPPAAAGPAVGTEVQVCAAAADLRRAVELVGEDVMAWDPSLAAAVGRRGKVAGYDEDVPGTADVELDGGDMVTVPVGALQVAPPAGDEAELQRLLLGTDVRLCSAAQLAALTRAAAAACPDDLQPWPADLTAAAALRSATIVGFDADAVGCADVCVRLDSVEEHTWAPLAAMERDGAGAAAEAAGDLKRLLLGASLKVVEDAAELRRLTIAAAARCPDDLQPWDDGQCEAAAGAVALVEGWDDETPHCVDVCLQLSAGPQSFWAPLTALR